MRPRPALALLALLAIGAAGCSRGPRTRCERVCATEARCADELELPTVDLTECVEACSALERDSHTATTVTEHVRCVTEAQGCDAVMACE